ncbi:MAG TPA: excinuclease ABC subunit UvrA [Verrucomicrobiota bacterium]|nr:excinuclease ABC subunit UvrA [Verrucomicrobiota bacterium]
MARAQSRKTVSPADLVSARRFLRLRGVRQNNLKGFDLDLPLGKLIVITGLSGSGKSSLAFDTLYAEGQRRYIETFTPYARQFFDRMDKPAVDRIENIPPAIAIEQRNAVRSSRSTIGTMTEICDYLKVIWPHWATRHCRHCGRPVRREPAQDVWRETLGHARAGEQEVLITFDLPLTQKLSWAEQLDLLGKQGFRRLLVSEEVRRLEEVLAASPEKSSRLTVVADRVRLTPENRPRFVEACEQAYHFGRGKLCVRSVPSTATVAPSLPPRQYSAGFHCAECDLDYPEPTPALFSFNNPVGACPTCKGFGRVISIDPDLALPDRTKTLAEGVVKPWQSGMSAECQADLLRMARRRGIPVQVPFRDLSAEHQRWVMEGDPGHDADDPEHSWPNSWYGVKGFFRWLESKAYKMHVRVLLSRYRSYRTCADCGGKRFNADSLLYRLTGKQAVRGQRPEVNSDSFMSLADFYALPIRQALALIDRHTLGNAAPTDPVAVALGEVRTRLGFLNEVGLGYLSLDRATRTLSGGETERVNLTTCLGTRLTHTLFVLDEPSVGLHPRDTDRLVRILHRLRDAGNTVVVVEHEASVMRAADQLVALGPGHGDAGGPVVFQGSPTALTDATSSLTADYLLGRRQIRAARQREVTMEPTAKPAGDEVSFAAENPVPYRAEARIESVRRLDPRIRIGAELLSPAADRRTALGASQDHGWLRLRGATAHNLRQLAVDIPLRRLVCLTGVSGSGKTTLVREVLLPLLQQKLAGAGATGPTSLEDEVDSESREEAWAGLHSADLDGWQSLGAVVLVDQSSLGRTPRSNPAVYVGAFDDIREVFAASPEAQDRGLAPGAFSFNSAQGQCERCRGAGFEKIEMQFLSDVFVRCPVCQGRRYREHILEVKIRPPSETSLGRPDAWSIDDVLAAPVEDAREFFAGFRDSKAARRAVAKLTLLCEVGLGYLRVGQPVNTLSGGESQRLKLVSHLAESAAAISGGGAPRKDATEALAGAVTRPTFFLFDEPTTGLHFDDVRVLLAVFQRLVDAGHSVLVIEHNLDVIRAADWILDLGPDAGDEGGQLVVAGTPAQVAACEHSHTGQFLREGGG